MDLLDTIINPIQLDDYMTIQSEYFDPDTGIIHISQLSTSGFISAGGTEGSELGLEDTSFDDVKVKVLSIKYWTSGFVANTTGFDTYAYNINNDAAGQVIFGVTNKNQTINDFTGLASFTGTSAWPVHLDHFQCPAGTKWTVSKTWKPRKLALSAEQNAFITVRSDSSSNSNLQVWQGMYMRLVRL